VRNSALPPVRICCSEGGRLGCVDEQTPQEQGVEIDVPSELESGTYANFAVVHHTQHEVTIDFCQLGINPMQPGESPTAKVVSRINIAPTFVIPLLQAISENTARREDNLRQLEEGEEGKRDMSETITIDGLSEVPEPRGTQRDEGAVPLVRYRTPASAGTFRVGAPRRPPHNLRLTVEAALENGAFFMRAIEVDVAVEGDTILDALHSLIATTKGWLEYLQEESPELASDLEGQRRYVALLDYQPPTWFKPFAVD